jgi:hypothetical protein
MSPRAALAALLLAACAQTPPTDGDPVDAGPDAAAPGTACAADADCASGRCLPDDAAGGGKRCFAGCAADRDCADGARCEAGVCRAPATAAGEDEPCADRACAPDLACSPDHPDGLRCERPCTRDADCAEGRRCAPDAVDPRVCLPAGAAAFQCPATPCRAPDLLCVPDAGGIGRCDALCARAGEACPEGGRCVERSGDGARYCEPRGDRGAGESCASGGDAACSAGLTCIARGPGDPEGICSTPCAGDCADGFACRAPWPGVEAACLPQPAGTGPQTGGPGDPCDAHGHTDCRPDLFCTPGTAGRAVCAAPCAGACPDGFECVARGDQSWCLRGTTDERRPLGAPCADAGAGACASGVCVGEGRPEDAVCSQPCAGMSCPDGFRCAALDAGHFCLPSPP